MTDGTAANKSPLAQYILTKSQMEEVINKIQSNQAPGKWVLVSPSGSFWIGDYTEVFSALSAQHPLLSIPPLR